MDKKQVPKYKIILEIPFKVGSKADASVLKQKVKQRTPNIRFTPLVKSGKIFSFKGRLQYTKSIAAPAATVKRVIAERTPGASVRVMKV